MPPKIDGDAKPRRQYTLKKKEEPPAEMEPPKPAKKYVLKKDIEALAKKVARRKVAKALLERIAKKREAKKAIKSEENALETLGYYWYRRMDDDSKLKNTGIQMGEHGKVMGKSTQYVFIPKKGLNALMWEDDPDEDQWATYKKLYGKAFKRHNGDRVDISEDGLHFNLITEKPLTLQTVAEHIEGFGRAPKYLTEV